MLVSKRGSFAQMSHPSSCSHTNTKNAILHRFTINQLAPKPGDECEKCYPLLLPHDCHHHHCTTVSFIGSLDHTPRTLLSAIGIIREKRLHKQREICPFHRPTTLNFAQISPSHATLPPIVSAPKQGLATAATQTPKHTNSATSFPVII